MCSERPAVPVVRKLMERRERVYDETAEYNKLHTFIDTLKVGQRRRPSVKPRPACVALACPPAAETDGRR